MDSVPCDVLVLDMNLPDRNGFEVLDELSVSHPNVAVVVLTMLPENPYAERAIRAGASAFVTKGTDSDMLFNAIRRAMG